MNRGVLWIRRAVNSVVAIINFTSRATNIIASGVLVAMMLLVVADVVMRYVLRSPIIGATELTEYMMVCVVFFALAWCALMRKHVKVDLLLAHFSPRAQAIIDSTTCFFSLGVGVIITWRSVLESISLIQVGKISSSLEIPIYIFYFVSSFGFAVLCVVILILLIQLVSKGVKG